MNEAPNVGKKRSKDERDTLTLYEVFSNEMALQEEANEKIKENWGVEGICTFIQGYQTQNLFSCLTCQNNNDNKDMFGFCYGCSLQCHLDHDIVELFSKRNFRCDCGLHQCGTCELYKKSKDIENKNNLYNQNFKGLYCFCNKIYNPETDEMIQCYFCQDWFHVECVNEDTKKLVNVITSNENEDNKLNYVPDNREDGSMICSVCMGKYPFLKNYYNLQRYGKDLITFYNQLNNLTKELGETETSSCLIKKTRSMEDKIPNFTSFWIPLWRSSLCTCNDCKKEYIDCNIDSILKEPEVIDDNLDIPTESVNLEEIGMQQLSNQIPDASQQLDVLQGFNMLSNELKLYLAPFAENGITVTKEHIEQFFESMKQKKRRLE